MFVLHLVRCDTVEVSPNQIIIIIVIIMNVSWKAITESCKDRLVFFCKAATINKSLAPANNLHVHQLWYICYVTSWHRIIHYYPFHHFTPTFYEAFEWPSSMTYFGMLWKKHIKNIS